MSFRRWSIEEESEILLIREKLKDLIETSCGYPDVIGDRKILRFLRGHDHNIEKVIELVSKYLIWRRDNGIDTYRNNIVNNGMDHPLKFPNGELILSLVPQLVIAPFGFDKMGCPLCVDQYNFSPAAVLEKVSLEQYITFAVYCLEYRSIILEQISEQRERKALAELTAVGNSENKEVPSVESPSDSSNAVDNALLQPYGVLVNTCVIRDLSGVGFEHLGSRGLEIIKAVVTLASDFYPELMRKCYMVNTPWVFNTIWYFVKGLLAPRTLAKISVMGTSFLSEISGEIDEEFLPSLIGGPYNSGMTYEPFPFDCDYLNSSILPNPNPNDLNPNDLNPNLNPNLSKDTTN
mmetsp:Transcript_31222/g.44866  ORF Transcript_31222/g.44866 Transcript_31222/m.44866 type:complete len:349 (+) Transcript_31222:2523-3569(+)